MLGGRLWHPACRQAAADVGDEIPLQARRGRSACCRLTNNLVAVGTDSCLGMAQVGCCCMHAYCRAVIEGRQVGPWPPPVAGPPGACWAPAAARAPAANIACCARCACSARCARCACCVQFSSLDEYLGVFDPLILEEAREGLKNDWAEACTAGKVWEVGAWSWNCCCRLLLLLLLLLLSAAPPPCWEPAGCGRQGCMKATSGWAGSGRPGAFAASGSLLSFPF